MRNWSSLLVAALGIAAIGCGGGGGGGTGGKGGGGGGGGGGGNSTSINLPPNGAIDVSYVPGAGRAAGDLWATFTHVYFDDQLPNPPDVTVANQTLQLNSYTTPLTVNVPVLFKGLTVDTRRFQDFWLDLRSVTTEVPNGTRFTLTNIVNIPYQFAGLADIRVFKGRRTGLQVFLDPTMFQVNIDPFDPNRVQSIEFLPDRFKEVNVTGVGGVNQMEGFLADYVGFNITQLPAAERPAFRSGGGIANYVYFSGDGYAIGGSAGDKSKFEALTLNTFQPIEGHMTPKQPDVSRPGKFFPGTYSLLQANPSSIDRQNAKLISLVGIWYDHYDVVTNMSETQMISFPRSRDDSYQDVVLLNQKVDSTTGKATITGMKWGFIHFTPDLSKSELTLFSLKDLVNGTGPYESGTVTNLKDANGNQATTAADVRTATFTVNGTTGPLVVFRE